MDIATEHFGEIHGTNEFEILGNGVTLDAEGDPIGLNIPARIVVEE